MNDISERAKKLQEAIEERRKRPVAIQLGERLAQWFLYTVAIILFGTPLGLWIKLFWMDYILQVCR